MEKLIENEAILIADSHHGQYIPQIVVKGEINNPLWDWSECNKEDIDACIEGIENEWYWDAWVNILDNVVINNEGEKYILVQNEDLWAIPEDCIEQLDDWLI